MFSSIIDKKLLFTENAIAAFRKATGGVLWKKTVLKNFEIFSEKHRCFNIFLIEVCYLIKKRLQHSCLPVNIAKLLRKKIL